jgi:hypothetical protein
LADDRGLPCGISLPQTIFLRELHIQVDSLFTAIVNGRLQFPEDFLRECARLFRSQNLKTAFAGNVNEEKNPARSEHSNQQEDSMTEGVLIAHCGAEKISRNQLASLPVPEGTATWKPIPHHEVVNALIETLGFRQIAILKDEYAATPDGMKMFGVLTLEQGFQGCRFSIGIRNSNDKSMRLAMTVGYQVMVCDNLSFRGDFTPVLAKHSKNFSILDSLAIGVDRMQREFEPMKRHVEQWRESQITDDFAKLTIYRAFIQGELDAPKALARSVHHEYFEPKLEEFVPRTKWSLENAFTSSFKTLDPIPQFKAAAKLGTFLGRN